MAAVAVAAASAVLTLKVDLMSLSGDATAHAIAFKAERTCGEVIEQVIADLGATVATLKSAVVSQLNVFVPKNEAWTTRVDKLSSIGVVDGDTIQIRRGYQCRAVLLTTGKRVVVPLFESTVVDQLLPMICQKMHIPHQNMGLKVEDRDEFLEGNKTLAAQGIDEYAPVIVQTKKTFEVPLEHLCLPYQLPALVRLAIQYIDETALTAEGIYRLSGSAHHIMIYKDVFNKGGVVNFRNYGADAHVVSGLLKLFLRELPEPPFPFALYTKFCEVATAEHSKRSRMKRLLQLLGKIPERSHFLLRHLFAHLHRVAQHSEANRMPPANLSAVVGPNILRAQTSNMSVMMRDTPLITQVCQWCIEEYDYLFMGVPKEYSSTRGVTDGDGERSSAPDEASAAAGAATTQSVHEQVHEYALALHDFSSSSETELALSRGDIVTVSRQIDGDWLEGSFSGRSGYFPVSYVQRIPVTTFDDVVVMFSYEARDAGELSVTEGTTITTLSKCDDDWWFGVDSDGHKGLFPANHVATPEVAAAERAAAVAEAAAAADAAAAASGTVADDTAAHADAADSDGSATESDDDEHVRPQRSGSINVPQRPVSFSLGSVGSRPSPPSSGSLRPPAAARTRTESVSDRMQAMWSLQPSSSPPPPPPPSA